MIVGGGISGACLARELARAGDEPILLEADRPGSGATGRNAGFLLAEADCLGLAERAHGLAAARLLREVGVETREIVREISGSSRAALGLRWTGSVRLAEDARESRAFRRSIELESALVRATPADVAEAGTGTGYTDALVDPCDGVVHPLRLVTRVLRHARDAGCRHFDNSPVTQIRRRGARIDVVTPGGTVRAARVILATNAALRLLVRDASPLRPVRAQALVATVDPAPEWTRPVYATHGGDYWRPLADGRVLLGGLRRLQRRAENTRADAPTQALQGALDTFLRRLVGPAATIRVTHRWAGTMGFTPGGLPWLGALPRHRGLHVLAGLNGHGMGWAPALARRLAAHLTGTGPRPPAALRPQLGC